MRKTFTALTFGAAVLAGTMAFLAPAEARRGGGVHRGGNHAYVARSASRSVHVNRNVTRNVNRTYAYRNGRRGYWRNGVWIAAPAIAGATYAASCAYEYGRWKSTGSTYWRDRYNECAN